MSSCLFLTVVLHFNSRCDIIVSMRYSSQHRKAFVETFDFLSGHDALRLLLSLSVAEVKAGAAIGRSIHPYRDQSIGAEAVGACMGLVLAAGQVSVGMGLWAIVKMSRILLARMRRPKYYPNERRRRARLARERRRIRDRFTTGVCPKPEELLAQYAMAGTGVREALRFGSMLCDLEAYCDNSLLRNADGEIVGRNPGVKGWIRENCPELLPHYKNAMRYKGLAEKFRQASEAADPVPIAALVEKDAGIALRLLRGKKCRKITVRIKKANGLRGGRTVSGTYALEADSLETAWNRACEILKECEESAPARPRCEKTVIKKTAGGGMRGDDDRLRCGKNIEGRGGVARLERILDERLGMLPAGGFPVAMWRVGGAFARGNAESKRTSA